MKLLNRIFGAGKSKSHRVDFDHERIVFTERSGKETVVIWTELEEVGILTTDEGPAVDDVIWILVDKNRNGFAVPSESVGVPALLTRLQQLSGFDNEAVIRAMGCAENAKFICWRSSDTL